VVSDEWNLLSFKPSQRRGIFEDASRSPRVILLKEETMSLFWTSISVNLLLSEVRRIVKSKYYMVYKK